MRRLLALLAIGAATVTALASSAAASPATVQIVITHAQRGCHVWAVNHDRAAASQTLSTTPGARLVFTDDDVMPHRLVQLSGPKLTLRRLSMHTMGATAAVQLFAKGRYVFTTKAGEDYMSGVKTIGPDNVLRLVVLVR